MTSSHFSWRLLFAGITRQWSRKRKKRGRSSLDLSLIVVEIEGMGALRDGIDCISPYKSSLHLPSGSRQNPRL